MILERAEGRCTRSDIFTNKWLDVEPIYKEQGWDLKYVKLPYYETERDHFFYF